MSRRLVRLLFGAVVVLVLLGIAGAAYWPRAVQASFPQVEGEVRLPGLEAPVDVYRDDFGVPHIYASSEHDLFMAQGYIHAQDRFWQMDFWRHQGGGRLSELLGKSTLETDIFLNTLGWERVARQELEMIDPQTLAMLEAYAEGVNAYLADHEGTALALEYLFLPILNRGYRPEPWEPLHTLTWAKAMAWDLGGDMDAEIQRAMLLKSLSPQQVAELFPPYPDDRPAIVGEPHVTAESGYMPADEAALAAAVSPALEEAGAKIAALDALLGGGFEGLGSNNWVLSGDLTDSGMPILANDPHLAAQIPAIWYEVGLHCQPQGPDCGYEAVGFSFAGAPGIVIGHNQRIAWGFTNVGPDVQDLYIEKINPENPNQYEFEGQWVDMEIVSETIEVAGGEPVELTVRLTRHGPLITEAYGLEEFAADTPVYMPENYAIALRWTALQPNFTFRGLWNMNRAQDWEAFRAAAAEFAVPAQNLVYADLDGDIGYQMPGDIPIRKPEHTGLLPVPGWSGAYEWQGYIPFEEHPFVFNPPQGYVVTANNPVVGPEYPYVIAREWAYGLRAQRIVDLIEAAPGAIDLAYVQAMQGDNYEMNAETLVPVLLEVPLEDRRLAEARDLLAGWDYQNDMDSAPAALFAAFWKHLTAETFADELPEDFSQGGGRGKEMMRWLVGDPGNRWWDDQTTPEVERRDDIFRRALAGAVDELESKLGGDPSAWRWGDLHTLTFEHGVMSNFPLIDRAFNRGPFRTAGGGGIVNATGWSTLSGDYTVGGLPSMRMIVDFSDLENSLSMHTTGQSGHPGHPHYIDMADPWRNIQYHPMLWGREAVEAAADSHLRLTP